MQIVDTQFGPGRPIEVASRWVNAVLKEHDLAAGWPLMAEELRCSCVEAWVQANATHPALSGRDLEELPDLLTAADRPSADPLWGGFAISLVAEFREKWNHINPDHCGFLTNPRPIDLDRELLVYVDKGTADPVIVDGPEGEKVELKRPFVGFIMRHGETGWLIEDFELDGLSVAFGRRSGDIGENA